MAPHLTAGLRLTYDWRLELALLAIQRRTRFYGAEQFTQPCEGPRKRCGGGYRRLPLPQG
jgi:hypothetical protein